MGPRGSERHFGLLSDRQKAERLTAVQPEIERETRRPCRWLRRQAGQRRNGKALFGFARAEWNSRVAPCQSRSVDNAPKIRQVYDKARAAPANHRGWVEAEGRKISHRERAGDGHGGGVERRLIDAAATHLCFRSAIGGERFGQGQNKLSGRSLCGPKSLRDVRIGDYWQDKNRPGDALLATP